jgi:DNA primase
MAIPDEDVARVRAATDIAALIGEHTALKARRQALVGLCPFHSEKSPSFSVNPEEGLYYCFGCQVSGDAISFVAASRAVTSSRPSSGSRREPGHDPKRRRPRRPSGRGRRQALYEALKSAADFYHERLLSGADARHARQYLRSRGYDGDVVRTYRLGFAPPAYDALVRSKVLSQQALRRPASRTRAAEGT